MADAAILSVRDLTMCYFTNAGVVRAVDEVSFDVDRGKTLGLVGESGCGKSAAALSIVGLVPPPGRIVSGQIIFDGTDLASLTERGMRAVRGRKIGFVFQDPMSSLNPTMPVGLQIAESAQIHLRLSRRAALSRAADLLGRVGIPRPRERMHDFPHQFSGGMRQRVMISMALACEPSLLLADEPTTALDVTIQAQILDLIRSLSAELGMAVVLITHDLGIAAGMCDSISVMYAGRIVEIADVDTIFERPQMPYTRGLLASIPRPGVARRGHLETIEGAPPDLIDPDASCRFAPRCRYVHDICWAKEPALTPRQGAQFARCWGTEPGGWLNG